MLGIEDMRNAFSLCPLDNKCGIERCRLNLAEQTVVFGVLRIFGRGAFVKGAYAPQSGFALDKSTPSKCKIVNQKQRYKLERKCVLSNIGF